ncbi:MAG: hypothetical protein ACI85F_001759 [Bacteroidia bacterium]
MLKQIWPHNMCRMRQLYSGHLIKSVETMDNEKRTRVEGLKRFGPRKLSYNEILEMELSKVKEYIGLLTQQERTMVFASAKG